MERQKELLKIVFQLYDDKCNIYTEIVKTGKVGEATFRYTLHYKEDAPALTQWSDEIEIPADGIYELENGLKIYFFDGYGQFLVGDTYITSVELPHSKRDYTPIVTGAVFLSVALIMFGYMYLASMKERPNEYILSIYKPVVAPERQNGYKKGKRLKSAKERERNN